MDGNIFECFYYAIKVIFKSRMVTVNYY